MTKANKDFFFKGVFFEKGDEVNNIENYEELNRLNEKGFIEPLKPKEIQNYKFKKEEKVKEEE